MNRCFYGDVSIIICKKKECKVKLIITLEIDIVAKNCKLSFQRKT